MQQSMIKTMLQRYQFHYPAGQDEVKARLEKAIVASKAEITAEFTDDGVKVYRDGGFLYNSYNPIFVGKFRGDRAGTVLGGHFRFHAFILIFVAALIGTSLYNLIDVLRLPELVPGHAPGWRTERLIFELQFLGFAVVIPVVGWLVGLRTRNLLLSVIRQSTDVGADQDARNTAP